MTSVSGTCSFSLLPSLPGCGHLPEAAGSSAMLCHTPSHSTAFVFNPVAACQAQPQTHTLTTRLPATPSEPAFTSVHAHLCQILVSPTFVPPHAKSRCSNCRWASGCVGKSGEEGRGGEEGAYVLRGLVATILPTHTVNKIRSSSQSQRAEQQQQQQQQRERL